MDNYFYKYSHLWNKAFILSSDLDILVPVLNFSEKFVLKTITIYLIGPESNKLDKEKYKNNKNKVNFYKIPSYNIDKIEQNIKKG